MTPLTIALIQLSAQSESAETMRALGEAALLAELNTDLAVFPELWMTGYFNFKRYGSDAMTLQSATTAMAQLAAAGRCAVLGGSFIEVGNSGQLYNTAVMVTEQGTSALVYRKAHLFPYQSSEPDLLTSGREFPVCELGRATVGVQICYDIRFPEVSRSLVKSGATLLIVPAAWPRQRKAHWRLLLRARAVENQCFVVGCAAPSHLRSGNGGPTLSGGSVVVDPLGEVIFEGAPGPGSWRVTIDLDIVDEVRSRFNTTAVPVGCRTKATAELSTGRATPCG